MDNNAILLQVISVEFRYDHQKLDSDNQIGLLACNSHNKHN